MADSVTGTGGEPPTKRARHGDGDDQRISPDMAKLYSLLETVQATWPDEFADVFAVNMWLVPLTRELAYLARRDYPMKEKVGLFYEALITRAGKVLCDKVELKIELNVLLADSAWDRVA